MPFADLSEFAANPEVDKIGDLYTVDMLVHYVQSKFAGLSRPGPGRGRAEASARRRAVARPEASGHAMDLDRQVPGVRERRSSPAPSRTLPWRRSTSTTISPATP